jgi:ubiquinone/menaquinone biosynthesis C-methylase UbiE
MPENVNSITERLIKDAGISIGMRVLDIGSGNGEVSLLLVKAVGSSGEVVGIDRDVKAIDVAHDKIKAESKSNVTFIEGDLSNPFPNLGLCDAAFGRRVLMYLPNPVDTIRHISAVLKPNGVVAFQESDSTMVPGRVASLPLHEKINDWIWL